MKSNVMIIGDSYSTYEGYIPEGYNCYYRIHREEPPFVHGVEKTWWNILARENNLNIVMNDSFSGSTVCNTVRENHPLSSSFINRIDKYLAEDFFAKNDVGTLLLFGGTNDSWIDDPIGALQYSDWTAEDLLCVLPAFCYLLDRAKSAAENIIVIINSELKQEITEGFMEACKKYDIPCLLLKDVDKQNGHPTELGMEQIAEQVAACYRNQ